MLLPGWCTDRTGLKWHWINDRAMCRNFVISELSCIPYLNVRHHTALGEGGKRIAPRPCHIQHPSTMSNPAPMTSKWQTDWRKCCLCQKDKRNEDLKSPPTCYSCEQDGYTMIVTNAPLFHTLNEMPLVLDRARLDEGGGIEETLKKNKAQYHQTCRYLFQNYRLEWARKRQPIPGSAQSIEGCTKLRRTSHAIGQPERITHSLLH